jgi:DNA-binding winged helix-turn-helix (wHTH) protein
MNLSLAMPKPRHEVTEAALEFGNFRVLVRQRRLLAGGVPVELGARAFDILVVLIEANGALVTKDELQRRIWGDLFVLPENLKVQVAALRKALGEARGLILTDYGRGYRFTAAVRSTAGVPERLSVPGGAGESPSSRPPPDSASPRSGCTPTRRQFASSPNPIGATAPIAATSSGASILSPHGSNPRGELRPSSTSVISPPFGGDHLLMSAGGQFLMSPDTCVGPERAFLLFSPSNGGIRSAGAAR